MTYQPFAENRELNHLSHELRMNVSERERVVSGVIGLSLAAFGVARHGLSRWGLLLAGAALLRRSFTGHCPVYKQLDIDTRHDRAGVPGNRGTRVEASVDVDCPAETLFRFWRNLEQLPRVMRNVESVQQGAGKQSHWKVAGPLGQSLEWDAEIVNEHENRLIAWQSLPGATVSNAGSVRFEPIAGGVTRVKVAFEFDPPAGAAGALVAKLLGSSPQADLSDDLGRFKEFAETKLNGAAAKI